MRDITPTDVTSRSFAVVWVANEAVTNASLTLFSDATGATNITPTLPPSAFVSPSLAAANGVVKVTLAELDLAATYCFQTRTVSASGTTLSPSAPPYPCVITETSARLDTDTRAPIVNDLLRFELFKADQTTPLNGGLVLVNAKEHGSTPLSAFVGDGYAPPTAVTNLRNVFDRMAHTTAALDGNDILEVREVRGLAAGNCPSADQTLFHYRRAPIHAEGSTLGVRFSELERPATCFFADTVCDDRVDILDVQRILNLFNKDCSACQYNQDLDIVNDCTINILDVQSVLNRFGQTSPFPQ